MSCGNFQVVQAADRTVTIKIVPAETFKPDDVLRIRRRCSDYFGVYTRPSGTGRDHPGPRKWKKATRGRRSQLMRLVRSRQTPRTDLASR